MLPISQTFLRVAVSASLLFAAAAPVHAQAAVLGSGGGLANLLDPFVGPYPTVQISLSVIQKSDGSISGKLQNTGVGLGGNSVITIDSVILPGDPRIEAVSPGFDFPSDVALFGGVLTWTQDPDFPLLGYTFVFAVRDGGDGTGDVITPAFWVAPFPVADIWSQVTQSSTIPFFAETLIDFQPGGADGNVTGNLVLPSANP
jgi:hypothetical protein